MSIDRTTIIRGPAAVMWQGDTIYSKGDITVRPIPSFFDVPASAFGVVDKRRDDMLYEITFEPAGAWTGLPGLFPFQTPVIGDTIFGATDRDLVVHTLAGQEITYYAAAVTQIPDIRLSAVQTLLGPVTFTAVGANDTAWSDAAKRSAIAAVEFDDGSFDPTDILTQPYSVAWGVSSPWDAIDTENGVVISIAQRFQPVRVDSEGTVDMTLEDIEVSARFRPVGVTEAQIQALMKLQGSGVLRGSSLTDNTGDLVCSATGVHVIGYALAPTEGPLNFGRTTLRAGELAFMSLPQFTNGARTAAYYVGTSAPA